MQQQSEPDFSSSNSIHRQGRQESDAPVPVDSSAHASAPDLSAPGVGRPVDDAPDHAGPVDDGASLPFPDKTSQVPNPLLEKWTVWDIDGDAVMIEDAPADSAVDLDARTGAPAEQPPEEIRIPDQIDTVLLGRLGERNFSVAPGEVIDFSLSLLNNSPEPAIFALAVEGWVDEQWFPDLPQDITLEPGVWTTLSLRIAPPNRPESRAGEHAFAVTLRSPQHAGRVTRLGAVLSISSFAGLALSFLEPDYLECKAPARAASARLQVTNGGNQPARYRVWGVDSGRCCEFAFRVAGEQQIGHDELVFALEAGETRTVGCRVAPLGMPPLNPFGRVAPFRVNVEQVEPVAVTPLRRMAAGRMMQRPLIGLWPLAALLALVMGAFVVVGIVGIMAIISLQNRAPAAATVVEQPVFAIMLQMHEPVPQRELALTPDLRTQSPVQPSVQSSGQVPVQGVGSPDGSDVPVVQAGDVSAPGAILPPNLPDAPDMPGVQADEVGASLVVRPDQVSAPGESPPLVGQGVSAPASTELVNPEPVNMNTLPARPASMTYAQMFQAIGMRYDVDWRMLAAQAYVESGFDALALGHEGSLGLMQIQPATWREWAPKVGASDPFDSYSSTLVAGIYLDYLRELLATRGYPQTEWMLVAYNWGPDKLLGFLQDGGDWAELPEQVRTYAEDVLRIVQTIP